MDRLDTWDLLTRLRREFLMKGARVEMEEVQNRSRGVKEKQTEVEKHAESERSERMSRHWRRHIKEDRKE